jgi:hypothetical protein
MAVPLIGTPQDEKADRTRYARPEAAAYQRSITTFFSV